MSGGRTKRLRQYVKIYKQTNLKQYFRWLIFTHKEKDMIVAAERVRNRAFCSVMRYV